MARLLVVTNDFPPRTGGIQTFVGSVVEGLDPADVVVYTSTWRDPTAFDAAAAYPIVREARSTLLPTPGVTRTAVALLREHNCTDVWFGAAAPLGLMAPALRRAGARRIVATTHGHEIGWARLPGARDLLRRIATGVDAVTYLGEFTRLRLAKALGHRSDKLVRMSPGVDATTFTPEVDGGRVKSRLGLVERPVIVCVSRLMPRKGQDTLIRALPKIRREVPDVALLLVGGGPARKSLQKLAGELGVESAVVMSGSVPFAQLPGYYRAGDVFAMPCRARLGGLDVEGLGMVFLEASACGLPVVVGDSGGAPDTLIDGETGRLVNPRSPESIATAITELLLDPAKRTRFGKRGRKWVVDAWSWETTMAAFDAALAKAGGKDPRDYFGLPP